MRLRTDTAVVHFRRINQPSPPLDNSKKFGRPHVTSILRHRFANRSDHQEEFQMFVSRVARIAAAAITLASLTTISRAQSAAWKLPDYSAMQSMGNMPPGKIYQSGSNIRAEPVAGLVTIYQSAKNKVYSLYATGYCIEMPAEKALTPNPLQLLFGGKLERTPIGKSLV